MIHTILIKIFQSLGKDFFQIAEKFKKGEPLKKEATSFLITYFLIPGIIILIGVGVFYLLLDIL